MNKLRLCTSFLLWKSSELCRDGKMTTSLAGREIISEQRVKRDPYSIYRGRRKSSMIPSDTSSWSHMEMHHESADWPIVLLGAEHVSR